jgi:hypothetical protein
VIEAAVRSVSESIVDHRRSDGHRVGRKQLSRSVCEPDRRRSARPDRGIPLPRSGRPLPVFSADGRLVPLASRGPAAGRDSGLLREDGSSVPGLFGLGLGSGFVPWERIVRRSVIYRPAESLWLYQHGLGEMIYRGTRRRAAQRDSKKRGFDALPIM